jgi:hypothetical protein
MPPFVPGERKHLSQNSKPLAWRRRATLQRQGEIRNTSDRFDDYSLWAANVKKGREVRKWMIQLDEERRWSHLVGNCGAQVKPDVVAALEGLPH